MTCTGGTKPDHILAPNSPYHQNIIDFNENKISQNVFMDDAGSDPGFEAPSTLYHTVDNIELIVSYTIKIAFKIVYQNCLVKT